MDLSESDQSELLPLTECFDLLTRPSALERQSHSSLCSIVSFGSPLKMIRLADVKNDVNSASNSHSKFTGQDGENSGTEKTVRI